MEHTHLKMAWIQHHIHQKDGFLTYPPPPPPPALVSPYADTGFHKDSAAPSPPSTSSSPSSSGTRISPAVLFIIVILAVLFFISGLLHLLVRFLIKHPSSSGGAQSSRYPELSSSDALQRQLQQLFHLHDSGLDQAFIDALPVFQYKEIVGLKEPFDCAVCLCEFSEKDKLRLLPMCSHAFHISCIDTWLLSNSSCPLCRGTLFNPGFENPIFDYDDFREDEGCQGSNVGNGVPPPQKTVEIEEVVKKGVVPVRLGKFRRLDGGGGGDVAGGETSSSNLDARRCFSMGSYQYVLANSDLRVPLSHDDGQSLGVKLTRGREESENPSIDKESKGKKITSVSKGESYSVSKIWLWSKKGMSTDVNMGMPSSLSDDLPWMKKTQEK
ncbi:unnamed protein product [Linum tenue]|uniref:RING-type E3 ubiquitin transferase n=2 Tax=Linum tenue TaxID=586396 RepID=A0AAV0RRX4_9ROSI|nr:unnamed protein product [Linum tenue]